MIKIWQIHNFIDQNSNWKFSKKRKLQIMKTKIHYKKVNLSLNLSFT